MSKYYTMSLNGPTTTCASLRSTTTPKPFNNWDLISQSQLMKLYLQQQQTCQDPPKKLENERQAVMGKIKKEWI